MTFTATNIIASASTTLLDANHKRWPKDELISYINDGLKAIVTMKPNAATDTVTLALGLGTLQTLPEQYTVLSRVTRNLLVAHTDEDGPVGGATIRPLKSRDLLDSTIPGWQSNEAMFAKTVRHVIYDLADPRHFYVAPGNTGTGLIEAVVGVIPAPIAVETDLIGLPDLYRPILSDYVIYRAFAKDSGMAASQARAAMHSSAFKEALSALAQGEATMSLSAMMQPSG